MEAITIDFFQCSCSKPPKPPCTWDLFRIQVPCGAKSTQEQVQLPWSRWWCPGVWRQSPCASSESHASLVGNPERRETPLAVWQQLRWEDKHLQYIFCYYNTFMIFLLGCISVCRGCVYTQLVCSCTVLFSSSGKWRGWCEKTGKQSIS